MELFWSWTIRDHDDFCYRQVFCALCFTNYWFLMILFLTKFMINVTTLILKLSISHFSDGDVPQSTSYGVYISQLIRFARASSYVTNFNTRQTRLSVS